MRLKAFCCLLFWLPSVVFAGGLTLDPLVRNEIKVVNKGGRQVFLVSLKGVLKIALDRAPQLVRWSKAVQSAEIQWRASQGAEPLNWTTQLGQNLSVSPYTFAPVSGTYLSVGATRSNQLSSELSQKTKWGLTYGLAYQKTISQTQLGSIEKKGGQASGFSGITDPVYADALKFNVKLPLLQGFGEVNRDGENRNAFVVEQTKSQEKSGRNQLLAQVASVYWDLVAVHQNLKSLDHALALAQRFYQESLTRLELGAMERTDVKQAELQVGVVKREQLAQKIQRKQIEDQIRLVLGLSQFDVEYEPTETLQVKTLAQSSKELVEQALAASTDLSLIRLKLKLNHLDQVKAEDKKNTKLDLNLELQLNGFGYDGSTATSGLSDPGTQGYLVSLQWKVPLFDQRPRAGLLQVALQSASLESEYLELKDQVKLQVGAYIRNLELAQQNIELAQSQAQLNRELLLKEDEKLRLGESTGYRRSLVQQDLTDSELALTFAQISYEKTYVSLMLLTDQFEANYGL